MAKRSPRSSAPAAGLFSSVPAVSPAPLAPAPLPVPGVSALAPEQAEWLHLAVTALQREIDSVQASLARPLVSWDQYDAQVRDANVSMSLLLGNLSAWLPADLRPLVKQFLEVRTSIILRSVEGRSDG